MTHWKAMTDRDTLGAWDLADKAGNPRDVTVEIVRVEKRLVKSKDRPEGEHRPAVYFKGARKPLICNATNAKQIVAFAGSSHVERWIGVKVTLYPTQVRAGKEMVDAIRIRPRAPSPTVEAEPIEVRPVDDEMRARQVAAMGGTTEGTGDDNGEG